MGFWERKNGFLVPKRHHMKHLVFLILLLEAVNEPWQKHWGAGFDPHRPFQLSSSLVRTC